MVKPIPDGYRNVNIHLVIKDAAKAIEFYKQAFGAEELSRMPGPAGKLMHAEFKIGDTVVMLADSFPEMDPTSKSVQDYGGSPCALMIYTEDADKLFDRAVKAGCTAKTPVTEMFWGDRYGQVMDPFGFRWAIATHVRDVTPDEMMKAMQQQGG